MTVKSNETVEERLAHLTDVAYLEGRVALDAVVGEVIHEMTHTLNFLRCLVEGTGDRATLSGEELTFAREERDRVQRLVRQLRHLRLPSPKRESVQLLGVLQQSLAVHDVVLKERSISIAVTGAEQAELVADERLLFILLREVLSAVIHSAIPHSTVAIRVSPPTAKQEGSICVSGTLSPPGLARARNLFSLGSEDFVGKTGLGLALAFRAARAAGLTISTGEPDWSGLRIGFPAPASEAGR